MNAALTWYSEAGSWAKLLKQRPIACTRTASQRIAVAVFRQRHNVFSPGSSSESGRRRRAKGSGVKTVCRSRKISFITSDLRVDVKFSNVVLVKLTHFLLAALRCLATIRRIGHHCADIIFAGLLFNP